MVLSAFIFLLVWMNLLQHLPLNQARREPQNSAGIRLRMFSIHTPLFLIAFGFSILELCLITSVRKVSFYLTSNISLSSLLSPYY